jgi:hypothetical protein
MWSKNILFIFLQHKKNYNKGKKIKDLFEVCDCLEAKN